ncbi:MAG: DUF4271 domain-containing protein [Bacteroidales bacterium]|nr:DUF4271 domain-containing protein [Bacteroidales bacterium]
MYLFYQDGQDSTLLMPYLQPPVSERGYSTEISKPSREGIKLPGSLYHADWITILLFGSVVLYAVVATFSRHIFSDLVKLITFGAVGKPVSDARGIFQWQTTLANLASFINLSLFIYLCTLYYETWFPYNATGPLRWFILFAAVSALITVRHFVTFLTGLISNSQNSFYDYLNSIYMLYRILGIAILPVVVAISYMDDTLMKFLVPTGFVIIIMTLIVRIIRLLNIFLQNGVSIFYFILYLCALEIMPAAVFFKWLSN